MNKIATNFGVLCVKGYQKLLSPLFPRSCKFIPSCSNYTLQAIQKFGLCKGSFLGLKRILKCHPKAVGGLDPVPENIKGDYKWYL